MKLILDQLDGVIAECDSQFKRIKKFKEMKASKNEIIHPKAVSSLAGQFIAYSGIKSFCVEKRKHIKRNPEKFGG